MTFTETPLKGAFVINTVPFEDNRGWFSRTFCKEEFEKQGLCSEFVQHNSSYNIHKGTIRGLHYQLAPYEEIKVVKCTRGKILDVIVDLRENSETYLQWFSIELTDENGRMIYVPEGFAHGFQTLCDNTDVFYLMSEFYRKGFDAGIRWNDEVLGINWPILDEIIISEKDKFLRNLPKRNL